ncbi:acyl-CoA thioesterase [Radiobacillus sp. PE A8.2]|uniref:acyl-CoA thioesterase n=1 Tax=Radiobacillus sp. PE A8.2 TaxID=3380349 RepID=UPI00388F955F
MMHEHKVKVRFNETDGLGHVSNISYFIYLEDARIELLRDLRASMQMDGWSYIVASVKCDYKQQAYFDDQLIVESAIEKIGFTSFKIAHKITNERGVIAIGEVTMVHFDFNKQASIPLQEQMRSRLKQFMES